MRYTVWSRDRLLGETDLEFIYREDGFRCGWLHPSELGGRLLPSVTGVPPALRTLYNIGPDPTARADVAAAVDLEAAFELQLRGPSGEVIATESIAVIDTHYLLSIARNYVCDQDGFDGDEEAESDALLDSWSGVADEVSLEAPSMEESEFPGYQIQVRLVDRDALP